MSEQNLEVNAEKKSQHATEFDGGTFTIDYLSTSANGFEVTTTKSERRRPRKESDPRFSQEELPLNAEQRTLLKNAMVGQMKFAEGNKAKEALDKLRAAVTPEEKELAAKEYEEKRKIYYNRNFPRVGLKNIRHQNNTLTVDIKPVDFPTYATFGKPSSTPELVEFANISSTSMLFVTRDKKLIIQHRSPRNKLYGDVPGTSAAGYFDGKPYIPSSTESKVEKKGTLQFIDTDFVKNNAIKEAEEELGLDRKDLLDLRILGLAHDKTQIHSDFLLLGTTSLSFDELKEKAQNAEMNVKLSDEEFREKFVGIPATPDAISLLITQVKCPIPPTLTAVFVAAGYFMTLKEKGLEEANKWKGEMELKVRKNYQQINHMVEKYYQSHPEKLNNNPEEKPPRNPSAYEPAYLPEEQGLPDTMSELKRVGLI